MTAAEKILAELKKRRDAISAVMRKCPPSALDRLGGRASEIERTIVMVEEIAAEAGAPIEPKNRY